MTNRIVSHRRTLLWLLGALMVALAIVLLRLDGELRDATRTCPRAG